MDSELIRQARRADLKYYFERRGHKLKREGRKGHYRVEGNQGLIIKNNMFCQFGTGKKGNSLDCLVEVLGINFKEAVEELTGVPAWGKREMEELPKDPFTLPPKAENPRRVIAYLCNSRLLDIGIVASLLKSGLLYQDEKGNCVFVWVDEGEAVGAEIVGTLDSVRFKGVAEYSKYGRGFVIKKGAPKKAYFFESAIDLLSFLTLRKGCPEADNAFFISMAGLKEGVVNHFLKRYDVIPVLCVDNDKGGEVFITQFKERGIKILKPENKDWSDDLREMKVK